jgi:hypothetical protein
MLSELNKGFIALISIVLFCGCSANNPANSHTGNHNNPDTTDHQPSGSSELHIEWDPGTKTEISGHTESANYSGYARMIKLDDGSLLCVYETAGNIVAIQSEDDGASWSDTTMVAEKEPGLRMSTPDILELDDHSLLVAYNPRPSKPYDQSRKFAIRTKKSFDGGKTWNDERVLYEAGYRSENGCWEPSAVQLPDGEIQLFFSNEGIYKNSNEQNISLLRSNDGGLTWTETPEAVSFRSGSRDGMPVPIVLQDSKEVVVSIEDNGGANFKPYTVRSSFKNDWSTTVDGNSSSREYALAKKLPPAVYAGAPYLVRLNNNTTLLSYQGTEQRSPNGVSGAVMRVVIGNGKARDFKHKSTPFDIPANSNGVWNSLSVLNDSTVIALTSTNAFSSNNHIEVWMIKGHVMEQ